MISSEQAFCKYCLGNVELNDFHSECHKLVNNYKKSFYTFFTTRTEFYNRKGQAFLFDRINIYPFNFVLSDINLSWTHSRENCLYELIEKNVYITNFNFHLMQTYEDYSGND